MKDDIIFKPFHFLVLIYILDGMILKMKKFVIQWRKFEFKRSCIFKPTRGPRWSECDADAWQGHVDAQGVPCGK